MIAGLPKTGWLMTGYMIDEVLSDRYSPCKVV